MRQGDTTTVTIKFSESIGQRDIKVGLYDKLNQEVFSSRLSDSASAIDSLGNNTYLVTIPHSVTKNFTGKYMLDLLLVEDGNVVNCCDNPIEIVFKQASIAKNLNI